jgi:hypothetical protein
MEFFIRATITEEQLNPLNIPALYRKLVERMKAVYMVAVIFQLNLGFVFFSWEIAVSNDT